MNDTLRDQATKRIKARRDFWNLVTVFAIVTVVLNIIWFVTNNGGYYWPMWPMIGLAIAVFFTALATFGPGNRPITDEQIDREMKKLSGH